ncbi:MAG TPA: alcohol dehydrogenase catalytic domain-containing protein [Microlunatus sp.]
MILALEYSRSAAAVITARALAGTFPGVITSPAAPLRLITKPELHLPGAGWVRLRPTLSGISGADLRLLASGYRPYLNALMSPPFVPGHEVVGVLADDVEGSGLPAGTRVVLDPVLGCAARGLPECVNCAAGAPNRCDQLTAGPIGGLRTGFAGETGGGWSEELIAHRSQLYAVPERMTDEQALLVQPLAGALHLVDRAAPADQDQLLVVGAGLTGLLTCWAARQQHPNLSITVVGRYPRQRELAHRFGATRVVGTHDSLRGVRRTTRAVRVSGGSRLGIGGRPERAAAADFPAGISGAIRVLAGHRLGGRDFLLGGVDVAIDAAGSKDSAAIALQSTRAGGRVVTAAGRRSDLTALWLRELELLGSYAATAGDYARAVDLVPDLPVTGLVGARYPLREWRQAIDHAQGCGKSGTVRVAFQLREDR